MNKTDEDWKKELTPEQYAVLREQGTEAPFTGKYLDTKEKGMYQCAACGQVLFGSETKFDSGTGWPTFSDPVNLEHIELKEDLSYGMNRTEVTCKKCGSHLGHLFPNSHEGDHYCINSCALEFKKQEN